MNSPPANKDHITRSLLDAQESAERQRLVEGELLAVVSDAGRRLGIAQCAVVIAPAAHHIEALQSEARRIDFHVATGTTGNLSVFRELIADRGRSASIRFEARHIAWWFRRRCAKDSIEDKCTPHDGRRTRAIGGNLQHPGHGEDPAAVGIRREFHFLERPTVYLGYVVMPGESTVEHTEIGCDKLIDSKVIL